MDAAAPAHAPSSADTNPDAPADAPSAQDTPLEAPAAPAAADAAHPSATDGARPPSATPPSRVTVAPDLPPPLNAAEQLQRAAFVALRDELKRELQESTASRAIRDSWLGVMRLAEVRRGGRSVAVG